jgi:hypothetical protein
MMFLVLAGPVSCVDTICIPTNDEMWYFIVEPSTDTLS